MIPAILKRSFTASARASATVPVIDFAPFLGGGAADKKRVARSIGDACENIGFLVVMGHSVPKPVIDAAWKDTRAFFDLPAGEKDKWTSRNEAEYPYGYVGMGKEILSAGKVWCIALLSLRCGEPCVSARCGVCCGCRRCCLWLCVDVDVALLSLLLSCVLSPGPCCRSFVVVVVAAVWDYEQDQEKGEKHVTAPDLKECFSMGPYNPASGMPTPRLPTVPQTFAASWLAYYKAMEGLSANLLTAFAMALELPPDWFVNKVDRHRCALRAL
jgi:isopenicillin N synthase-like dioxygenase